MRDRSWSRGSQLTFTAILAIGQLLMCMTPDWWLVAGGWMLGGLKAPVSCCHAQLDQEVRRRWSQHPGII